MTERGKRLTTIRGIILTFFLKCRYIHKDAIDLVPQNEHIWSKMIVILFLSRC